MQFLYTPALILCYGRCPLLHPRRRPSRLEQYVPFQESLVKTSNASTIQLLAVFVVMLAASAHAQTYNVQYNFGNVTCDPLTPASSGIIAQGRDGNMYSSTATGGCFGSNGAVFKVSPKGNLSVVYSFNHAIGDQILAFSGATLGTDGNFWGTNEGGDFGGNIWKVTPAGKETTFDVFGGTKEVNGIEPTAPPVQGMDGNWYGTTNQGGNVSKCTYNFGGCGVIYKITPSGKFKVIHTFDQANGANPDSPLVLGTDGNFYGTTYHGGTVGKVFENAGVIFKVTPAGTYTVLYVFCTVAGCHDGANPIGGLTQGTDGNFYGTTEYGGGSTILPEGVAFKVTPAGKLTVLNSFCTLASCKDGSSPFGGLVQATDGNLYGTTLGGGAHNQGIIFQVTPKGKFTILHSFQDATGSLFGEYPEVTLIQNTNGILYGDTMNGGTSGRHQGVFYSIDMGLKPFVSMVAWYGAVGNTIEILGQGLKGTTAVSFNGTPATTFTAVSGTYLTAVVPPGTTAGLVTVTTPGGVLTSNRAFKVLPGIQSFSPPSGPVGTKVTIAGSNFTGATGVSFGGVKATIFSVDSDTQITATVPAGALTGKIQVTTPKGTATSATSFLVTPVIQSFSPPSGPVGTQVKITGTSFTGATSVTFGGVPATVFTVDSDTQITATVPTGAVTGKIQVTTPGGTATSATDFTVT